MANTPTKLLLMAALMATAACTKKPPKDLPPPPPVAGEPSPGSSGMEGSGAAGTTVPGSSADFKEKAGSDTVLFATDSYDLDGESRSILDRQIQWLQQYPAVRVTVEGHADERGTREYNLALGDRRANSAKNYLASQGVAAARITTISYGKERPVAMGSDEGAWAQNRRAVTVVIDGAR
ncbi:MAG: peptidoglycan-associated lipoprotein [Sphingomonas bacterium]|jgi:peptidoglycan-associated lipoprotein|nr:peptidoglycan-associated lipoprotein Pal [Sphingomonas bacterium]MDB5688431.1 peptidoglycan-associated lipoprotein [Sphingomonas bacterium]